MKSALFGLSLIVILSAFFGDQENGYPPIKNESFKKGEMLHFKMTYGLFTVGRGSAQVYSDYSTMNNRPCYKVEVIGRTVGMVSWVKDVDDRFSAVIDTASLLPHVFTRTLREGNYKKDEETYFDQPGKKISVRVKDKKTGQWKTPKNYEATGPVLDMIGGFLLLRNMDLAQKKVNDTLLVPGFFEDAFYKLKIIYKGKKTIRTKIGRIRCLVFKPVMPKNELFDGENSITAYFSDDKNRIPVKIEAEMFIGSAGVELTDHSGLRNPLNLAKH
jgi:hypothetical protein